MAKLLSWHNDPQLKQKYIDRVRAHRLADNLIQGTGWDNGNGKGCAVGCTLESYDHTRFPNELGLPIWIAHLEDSIFEGLDNKTAQLWPERFMEAIPVGVEVDTIKKPFIIWLLNFALKQFDNDRFKRQADAIKNVIKLYEADCTNITSFENAASAAAASAVARAPLTIAEAATDAVIAARYAAAAASDAVSDIADYINLTIEQTWLVIADKLIELIKGLKNGK